MNRITIVADKTIKEFWRNKMEIIWTFITPIFFLLIFPLMYGDIPIAIVPNIKGGLTLTMITFLIMFAGQSNLAGSIALDRERGLYQKMSSMPISPWKEGIGRVLGIWTLSFLGLIVLLTVGLLYGAQFSVTFLGIIEALGLVLLISLTSSGIGLIIASLVNGESAATHTGVALSLLIFFLGGMAFPYSALPAPLQAFARFHPISSANTLLIYLFEGESMVGYNPCAIEQIIPMIAISVLTFIIGLLLYSKTCWKNTK